MLILDILKAKFSTGRSGFVAAEAAERAKGKSQRGWRKG